MRSVFVLLILSGVTRLFAQDQGGIPDVEIQIVNPLKVILPKAERNFIKVPALPLEPITPPIVYDYSLVSFSAPSFSPAVRPLRIKPTEDQTVYPSFVSAGFGNFSSPYLRGYLSFFPSKSTTVGGLSFYHNSFGNGPIDGKNSSGGFSSISANIKASNNTVTTEALAGFENRSANFYGYDGALKAKKDTIKQSYSTFFVSGKVSNSKKSNFNYMFRPSFSYLTDKYEAKESDLSFDFNSSYQMKGHLALVFNSSYSLIARKDSAIEAKPRHLFRVMPQYQFSPIQNLIVRAGLNVVFENDSIGKKGMHVYPAASSTFSLGKNFGLFASLSGDMEKVSLHTLSRENVWLNSRISIYHTNKILDFSGGIRGDLGSGFGFMSGFAFARLKNLYFFKNSSTNQAKFDALYDDVIRTNFFASIHFDKGNYSFRIKGDYYTYSMDILATAWHRPKYRLDSYLVIKAADKLSIVPRLMVLGGLKAYDHVTAREVLLPTAIDLSASLEYNFSGKAGMFLKFNNLLADSYSLYYRYPVRSFQAMAGFTWKF